MGFVVGAIPTVSMILTSMLLSSIEVSPMIEAGFQNFAAGLIIAAVAEELFPLMLDGTPSESMIGITVGFVVGLGILHGVEAFVGYIEDAADKLLDNGSTHSKASSHGSEKGASSPGKAKTHPEGFTDEDDVEMNTMNPGNQKYMQLENDETMGTWEAEPLADATKAFANVDHRTHILEHLLEISDAVKQMEEKSNRLLEEKSLTGPEIESIAEKIDEEIHALQYKLDHTRRLVEGSEAQITHTATATWVTEDRKVAMKQRLRNLKLIVDHTIEHINDTTHAVDHSLLEEVHSHINEMDKQISSFHISVESASRRWKRSRALVETKLGDTLPMGLVVPVTVDCLVDGFLIGVSCSLAPAAGIILGAANCLEMGSLGMAYAARIKKCTGSSFLARLVALYVPPLLMFLISGLGALVGVEAQSIPTIFIALVAFGVVALLSLVCNELLIEAKEAQGDDERWYIGVMIFLGVWVILMLGHVFSE